MRRELTPRLHALATLACHYDIEPLPPVSVSLLAEGFRRAVLGYLVKNEALSDELRSRMLGWRHSGFSAHNEVRVPAEDAEGRTKLAGYMLRAAMRKIVQVLRLKYECGLKHRRIARSVGVARSTVCDYLYRAAAAGLGWPIPLLSLARSGMNCCITGSGDISAARAARQSIHSAVYLLDAARVANIEHESSGNGVSIISGILSRRRC